MKNLSIIISLLVAIEHIYILYIEMFAWETLGKKTFKSFPENLFEHTKIMAANQGLYNGFLAAGIFWSFIISDVQFGTDVRLFFLLCVAIAGIYGALTIQKKIFFTQAIPAIIAIVFTLIAYNYF